MSEYAIHLSDIHKSYNHGNDILRGIDLDVPAGSIVGLMGKNGAGKSTLIKILVGLLKTDSGTVEVLGENAWDLGVEAKQRLGYVPQVFSGFRGMKVENYLEYIGAFYAVWNEAKAKALPRQWGLAPGVRIANLSVGELQKLSIIQTLCHEPDLFIFDEPVASLDPLGRRQFLRELIDLNMNENRTMLLSTHIASDLERVAGDIAILKNGVIAYQGDFAALQERIRRLHITAARPLPDPLPIPKPLYSALAADRMTATVTVDGFSDEDIRRLQTELGATATATTIIDVEQLNLEDIFMEVHR